MARFPVCGVWQSVARWGRWAAVAVVGCVGGTAAQATEPNETLIALSRPGVFGQALVEMDSNSPLVPKSIKLIAGIEPGLTLKGLDYRPANKVLYSVAFQSELDFNNLTPRPGQLYAIDPETAIAIPIGGPITPGLVVDNFYGPTRFGFDFNPSIDAIRVVNNLTQNVVVNPDSGQLTTIATNLFYPADDPAAGFIPHIVSVAYDRNVAGTPATQQYGIDTVLNNLVTVANNEGTIRTVGPLAVPSMFGGFANVADDGGLDISGDTGIAYGLFTTQSVVSNLPFVIEKQALYTIDLTTGRVAEKGPILPIALGLIGPLDGVTVKPVGAF